MRLSLVLLSLAMFTPAAVSQGGIQPSWSPIPQLELRGEGWEIAYDVTRERVVLFGGLAGLINPYGNPPNWTYFDNTWEWDGTRWSLKKPAHRPPARAGHAMFYCPVRRKILLFGGVRVVNRTIQLFNDMWEWDGQDWRQLNPPTVPRTRSYMALATDMLRSRVVLFGGSTGYGSLTTAGDLDDTWEWDGQTWIQQFPQTVPLRRRYAAMAFLPTNGRCVMYGGSSYNGITWEWDGSEWFAHPAPSPDPLGGWPYHSHDMTTAPDSRSVILAGQDTRHIPLQTFRWDGAVWSPVITRNVLSDRAWWQVELATDFARGQMVMYGYGWGVHTRTMSTQYQDWSDACDSSVPDMIAGGLITMSSAVHDPLREEIVILDSTYSPSFDTQTWIMQGDEFELRSPSRQPPVRDGCGMVWHSGLGKVFVYGGGSNETAHRGRNRIDTWLWDGTTWTEHISATPPPRGGPADYRNPFGGPVRSIAYDSRRDRVVHFLAGETWEWEVTAGWQRRQPTTSPPWTTGALCYDPRRGVTVMGVYDYSRGRELWEYDGTTWVQRNPTTFPPPGTMGTMTYVDALGGIVAIDQGYSSWSVTTWLWDGQDWSQVLTTGQLANNLPHAHGVPVYDSTRQALRMLYSMAGRSVPTALVWELRFDNLTLAESSPRLGQSLDFSMDAPNEAGRPWVLGLSTLAYPGIPLLPIATGGVEVLPLAPSPLLTASASALMGGVLDAQGQGQFVIPIPVIPALEHRRIHAAAVTFDPTTPAIGLITNRVGAEIVR